MNHSINDLITPINGLITPINGLITPINGPSNLYKWPYKRINWMTLTLLYRFFRKPIIDIFVVYFFSQVNARMGFLVKMGRWDIRKCGGICSLPVK